jgi:protein-L-isoaspartate(D-aspartate) O-methyltransferase
MLYQLDLAPGQRVLEIGAGTGYNAALIRHIVGDSGQVTSVDIDSELVDKARAHLASAGYPDVTVVCADGAAGCAAHAPYDRIIATVGVSDLAPAWLDQAVPAARIVVPLDVRGTQVCVAFARAGPARWTSRSLAPCGFMRMRGSLAGPERIVTLAPGLHVTLPDGVMQPGPQHPDVDGEELASVLAGPSVVHETGVSAGPAEVFWELGLWLATREPRACRVDEEGPAGPARAERTGPGGRTGPAGRLGHAPLRGRGWRATVGLLDAGSIALLNATADPAGETSGPLTLVAAGFGPGASELAADLAAHARAWDAAGRPGVAGLRVDAYPRPVTGEPALGPGALVLERVFTRFAVYHA